MKRHLLAIWHRFEHTFSGYPIVRPIDGKRVKIESQAKNPVFLKPITETYCPIHGRGNITVFSLGKIDYKHFSF